MILETLAKIFSFSVKVDLVKLAVKAFKHSPDIVKAPPSHQDLKNFICYNQGMYAQYNFIASRRHRDLKTKIQKTTNNPEKVRPYIEALDKHLNSELENACLKSFEYIKNGFANRSKNGVRVCIKGVDENGDIIDLFRDRRAYFGDSYPLRSNTGFKTVNETGGSYICNSIPQDAKNGLYQNPRLNLPAVATYELSRKERKLINTKQQADRKWMNCWEKRTKRDGSNFSVLPESCYKSTMIIPMTLRGSSLKDEFRDHFKISPEADHKGIWGYLCFDSHSENLFDPDIDTSYGYIFADILSLYLISQLTYTTHSEVYNRALKLVGKGIQ